MSRVTFLVFVAVSALVNAEDDVAMSVNSRSFQKISEQPESQEHTNSLTDSETDDYVSAKAAREQRMADLIANHLIQAVDKQKAATALASEAEESAAALAEAAQASSGMQKLRFQSSDLRKAVEELTMNHGLMESAVLSAQRESAKAEVMQLQTEFLRLQGASDEMELELKAIERRSEEVPHDDAASDDEKFAELEKQTAHIMEWFEQLKALKAKRDNLKARKDSALKAAKALGITPEEVAKQLIKDGMNEKTVKDSLGVAQKSD